MIFESVVGRLSETPPGSRRVERIILASAELSKHRQRATTDSGREVGITLPHGVTLSDGDVLHLDDELAVVVEQSEEDLLLLTPARPEDFGLVGYQVGNLHRAAMINEEGVTVLYDTAVEAMAARFGIACERRRGKFVPIKNTTGHEH